MTSSNNTAKFLGEASNDDKEFDQALPTDHRLEDQSLPIKEDSQDITAK